MHTRALWVLCRSQPPPIKVHLISQPTSLLTCEIPLVFNNLYTTQFQSCGSVPHFASFEHKAPAQRNNDHNLESLRLKF